MRNRAKCKLCKSIIESVANTDYVSCACGEIAISGGMQKLQCFANNFENFMRVDDEGNEIIVTVKEKEEVEAIVEQTSTPSKEELLQMLDELRHRIDTLPQHAMLSPITHADFNSLLLLLSAIFRSD
jgi:hypothetical protein